MRSFLKELLQRRVEVTGDKSEVARFFGYFEPPAEHPSALAVR